MGALALTESKQSRSLCWWLWQVHSLAEEWGEDQNLASSSKNCSRSNFFRPLLAWLVKRSVQAHIVITKAKTTVSFEPIGQKPLMMIRATATKHLIGQDKNTFKMYIMMHRIWAMYTSNLFLQNKWLTDPLADLGCLMLQEDAVKSLNFFLTTYLLR